MGVGRGALPSNSFCSPADVKVFCCPSVRLSLLDNKAAAVLYYRPFGGLQLRQNLFILFVLFQIKKSQEVSESTKLFLSSLKKSKNQRKSTRISLDNCRRQEEQIFWNDGVSGPSAKTPAKLKMLNRHKQKKVVKNGLKSTSK
jgi:hypothetical protein